MNKKIYIKSDGYVLKNGVAMTTDEIIKDLNSLEDFENEINEPCRRCKYCGQDSCDCDML